MMTNAGKEYGTALYSLAAEEHRETELLEQLEQLVALLRTEPRYYDLLLSPAVSRQERLELADQAFKGRVDQYLLNFVKLLLERGRLRELPDCCKAYAEQYDVDHNILRVTAVTAVPLREELRQKLEAKLSAATEKSVVLSNRVEPAVLGGVCLEAPGRQMDDTLRTRLDRIRDRLLRANA